MEKQGWSVLGAALILLATTILFLVIGALGKKITSTLSFYTLPHPQALL